jgi:hypothetical protein
VSRAAAPGAAASLWHTTRYVVAAERWDRAHPRHVATMVRFELDRRWPSRRFLNKIHARARASARAVRRLAAGMHDRLDYPIRLGAR